MLTRQEKAELIRVKIEEINDLAKDLEGEGCNIVHQSTDPHRLGFVTITRTTKL